MGKYRFTPKKRHESVMKPTAALIGVDAGVAGKDQQSSYVNQPLFKRVKVEASPISVGNKCLTGKHFKPKSAGCYDWVDSRKRCSNTLYSS